jgi:hypothetical protein
MDGELWKELYSCIDRVDKSHAQDPRKRHRDAAVVATFEYSALRHRPVSWACDEDNWRGVDAPSRPLELPSQPTMSRRLRDDPGVRAFRAELAAALGGAFCVAAWLLVALIDGKALAVPRHSTDPDADFGRGTGAVEKGYRLHTLWHDGSPLPIWEVRPMSVAESTVARRLIAQLPDAGEGGGGYVLGDSWFDANNLYDRCAARGRQLLAPRRKRDARGLGHRAHSPHRLHALEMLTRPMGRDLMRLRRIVERLLGNLVSFGAGLGPLPPWVRRLSRVRLWVEGKLFINAIRIRQLLERVDE